MHSCPLTVFIVTNDLSEIQNHSSRHTSTEQQTASQKSHIAQTKMDTLSVECQIQQFREQLSVLLELRFLSNHITLSVSTPPSSNLYTELQQLLSKTGHLTDMALPDGNCFFRSVSKELLGTQAHHATIRKLLIQFLEHNEAHFSKITAIFGRPFLRHCDLLKKQGSWATTTELIGLATWLQIPVYIFSNGNERRWTWCRYKPRFSSADTQLNDNGLLQEIRSIIPPAPYHIELAHINESHFDRIQPPSCYTPPVLSGHETTNTRMNPVMVTD